MKKQSEDYAGGDISAAVQTLKESGNRFAVATVVRTISVTAAKPGAKAIIDAQGAIISGWIGGGCARHAVVKAAVKAIADGEPRLVSIQPEEILQEHGLTAGEENNGVVAASNMCPSRGSMDIFVEPVLSDPELLILGNSPVANMLAQIAESFSFRVVQATDHYNDIPSQHSHRYIVVATQGSGDMDALQTAVKLQSLHIGFVGSLKKTTYLKKKLLSTIADKSVVEEIKGPAGLDIGGVTPQEIALSILAEIVAIRRGKSQVTVQS